LAAPGAARKPPGSRLACPLCAGDAGNDHWHHFGELRAHKATREPQARPYREKRTESPWPPGCPWA